MSQRRLIGAGIWAVLVLFIGAVLAGAPPANGTIRGKATSTDGTPVANVKVTFTEQAFDKQPQSWTATTGADGTFSLELPAPQVRRLSVKVDGPPGGRVAPCAVAPQQGLEVLPGEVSELAILLAPATAKLIGTVLDEAGKPVADATVTLSWGQPFGAFSRAATADKQGKFEIANLAAGACTVRSVEPPAKSSLIRLSTWKPFGVASVNLSDGQTRTQEFRLPTGARLIGRVLDETGNPIQGATVSCSLDSATEEGKRSVYQMSGQWYSGEATTDADGCYHLGGLTQETYRVDVVGPEGAKLAAAALRGVNAPKAGDVPLQDVILYKGGTLAGKVLGPDGKPVAGAEASIVLPSGRHSSKTLSATTDAQGAFALAGLASGSYSVKVRPPEGSPLCEKLFDGVAVVAGLSVEQPLELPQGARVAGAVTGPDGKPVAGANVTLRYGYAFHASTVTDAQGKYAVVGLPPTSAFPPTPGQTYGQEKQVAVGPPDDAPLLLHGTAPLPDVPAGGSVAVDVVLRTGAAITGIVTGPDGKPVPGCAVAACQNLRGGYSSSASDRTDADGRYTLAHLTPSTMYLMVQSPVRKLLGAATPERNFEAGKTTTLDIAFEAGAVLAGKAVAANGKPVPGAEVRLQSEGNQPVWAWAGGRQNTVWTAADGSFRIEGVQAGKHQVHCSPLDPRLRAKPVAVTVQGKGEQPVEIAVYSTGSVVGTLRDAAGRPPAIGAFQVRLKRPEAEEQASPAAYPDERGRFRLDALVPGKYSAMVLAQRGKPNEQEPVASAEVVIEEGKDAQCNITVPSKPPAEAKP